MRNQADKNDMSALLTPIKLADGLVLRNRVAMLAMTRARAETDGTPNDLMAEYYAQRAGEVGLIISESTTVSDVGRGFINGPGMYTTEQALGWRKVVDAVHERGAKMVLQINHVGRLNNLQHLRRPIPPLSPSAIPLPRGSRKITINIPRVTPYARPRAIETEEVPLIAAEFARATRLALLAGFDGVQVHADSGYLIHQFLSTNVNQRKDRYGGSPENRARFALEVLDAVVAVNGPEYVSIKLTPGLDVGEIEESDLDEKYHYIVDELNKRKDLSFLHLYFVDLATSSVFRKMRRQFQGKILAEGSLSADAYEAMIHDGLIDMTGFGRALIANPDYLKRLKDGLPLSRVDADTIYNAPEAKGYTDYPSWDPANPEGSVVGLHNEYVELLLQKQTAES
jgi:N-ethylmaleimide reductase